MVKCNTKQITADYSSLKLQMWHRAAWSFTLSRFFTIYHALNCKSRIIILFSLLPDCMTRWLSVHSDWRFSSDLNINDESDYCNKKCRCSRISVQISGGIPFADWWQRGEVWEEGVKWMSGWRWMEWWHNCTPWFDCNYFWTLGYFC